ncbi:Zinc finger protein 74 [Holothuria leucospilota]|uniref:Zinc finger protein 74 n=1 Tax=Holothuria leucospilota TaxID=206669 RepID=A0A9Q1CPP0_HOLLE|nr:Zinc finger protein 74 [Holothuria leucospilota]
MIWGMTLNPGEEYLHEVYHQQHLTLASLDCRPGKSCDGSHPNCCLLLKTGSGEHVLCSLEKGLMHQQSLNLILHKGEKLTFFVEGTGTVYITGYSERNPEDIDGIPDEMSGELEESSETHAIGQTKNIINTSAEYLCTPVKVRRKKEDKNETEEKEINTFEEFDEEQHNTTTEKRDEQVRREEDEDGEEREATKDEGLSKDHPKATAGKTGKQGRQKEGEGSEEREASKDAENEERSFQRKKPQRTKKKNVTKQSVVKNKDDVKRLHKREYQKKPATVPKGKKQSKATSGGKRTCEICFRQVRYLNKHMRRLHIDHFKTFKCRYCKAQFLQDRNRKIHEENRACKHLHLKCRFCNRVATTRHTLVLHERTHTGERPFKCEVCDKTFAYKSSYSLHTKLHTGEKRFQCQYCDWKFIQRIQCISHERTHTGERPFKCEACGKAFSNNASFTAHKLTHAEERERPFGCRFCKKRFYRRGHLRDHEQRHTAERRFVCRICGEAFSFQKELKVHKESHAGS